jgi:hypothetical protein
MHTSCISLLHKSSKKVNPILSFKLYQLNTSGKSTSCTDFLFGCQLTCRKWAIEKLVYADCDYGWAPMESRKYALQPRKVFATGVHFAEYLKIGETIDVDPKVLRLYHYHDSIGVKSELCRDFTTGLNGEPNYLGIKNCTVDRTLTRHARRAKQFEIDTIGMQPRRSR